MSPTSTSHISARADRRPRAPWQKNVLAGNRQVPASTASQEAGAGKVKPAPVRCYGLLFLLRRTMRQSIASVCTAVTVARMYQPEVSDTRWNQTVACSHA
jgi:hypothetical protein